MPGIDWAAVQAAASWRLVVPRTPMRGRVGERLGAGTGSSLEFQDHRPYVPGDDLRHVDWKAYARSDVLSVRLYREEIAPRIDLVIDRSRSMAATRVEAPGVRRAGGAARVRGNVDERGHAPRHERGRSADPAAPPGRRRAVSRLRRVERRGGGASASTLRRQSMRVAVSDFLFPHDPDSLVGRLARDGASLAIVQLTTRDEAEPEVEGGRRLVDVEGHGELDVTIDARTVAEYRARFNRLRQGLSRAARRAGATFVHVIAGASPRQVARVLADAGILEPR